MNAMNQIILEGNVVRAPLVKDTPRGSRVCTLPIAVNRVYKDRNGTDVNEVGYFDIEAWGEKLSNSIEKCGWKGRGVRVVGRLKQNRWKTNDGKSMVKTIIVAEHLDFKPVFRKKADDTSESQNEKTNESADESTRAEAADGYEEDAGAAIENLQEAAAGLRAEQEAGETVF